jgi:hypothetical protein
MPRALAQITAEYITTAPPDFKLVRYCSTCHHDYKQTAWPHQVEKGTEGPEEYAPGWAHVCAPHDYEHQLPIDLWEQGYCGKTMCYGESHPGRGIKGDPSWSPDLPMDNPGPCMAAHTHFGIKCFDCVKLAHLDPEYNIFAVPVTPSALVYAQTHTRVCARNLNTPHNLIKC